MIVVVEVAMLLIVVVVVVGVVRMMTGHQIDVDGVDDLIMIVSHCYCYYSQYYLDYWVEQDWNGVCVDLDLQNFGCVGIGVLYVV